MKRTLPTNLNEVTSQNQLDSSGYEDEIISVEEGVDCPPPLMNFVLPSLDAGLIGSIVAPGGVGKSMLALELSILVATGADLTGLGRDFECKTGKVMYLTAEDGKKPFMQRLHALGKLLTESQKVQLKLNLEIRNVKRTRINIDEQGWQAYIERRARGRRLLFIDTFRRFHKLDENDSSAMEYILSVLEDIAERTGCSIVFLHHTNKSASTSGQGDLQQASRGSSVLADHGRWQINMVAMSREEADKLGVDDLMRPYYVRAGLSKVNHGLSSLNSEWLHRSIGGVLVPANFAPRMRSAKKGVRRDEI